MKKVIILIISIAMILLVAGCGNSHQAQISASHDVNVGSLSSYISSIELPKKLVIEFNPDVVTEKATAKEYNATWIKFDSKKVAETLFRNNIQDKGVYAQGPWIKAGDGQNSEEYLVIHDGVIHGGLTYTLFDNGKKSLYKKLTTVIDPNPGFPDAVAQTLLFTRKADYATRKDLTFMPYQKAVLETEKVLSECGFPSLSMQDVYSLDLDTMRTHYQLYIDASKDENTVDQFTWSQNDECYLLQFRQIIDGIPLINTVWEEGSRNDREATESPIYALYSNNGLLSIYAASLYSNSSAGKVGSLIGSIKAFQIFLDDYSKSIPISESKILSMELNYVGTYTEGKIQLVPAWILCISRSVKMENADQAVDEYTYFVINAFTGERIRTAVDSQ